MKKLYCGVNFLKKKVLITGGAGYIGSVLTPLLLKEKFHVTVIDNLLYDQSSLLDNFVNENFNFIRGDVTNFSLLKDLINQNDIIIPLAAIVGAPACDLHPGTAKLVNYDTSLEINTYLKDEHLLIYPNTNSGYGISNTKKYCDELSPLNPISQYAKEKVEIEKLFLKRSNTITFRLATVFGMSLRMRTDLLVNDFVKKALLDSYITLFEHNFRRNFIHVRDVANAFLFAIKNNDKMKGNSFNIGLSEANLTKLELAKLIKKQLPKLEINLSDYAVDKDKRDYFVSNEKIESLGWKADYSLEFGIKELIRGYTSMKFNNYSNI